MVKTLPEFYCPYSKNCYHCCLETEMTLSEDDITRIEKLGYQIEAFLEEKDGFMTLKNVDKKCIFLKNNVCSIYESRPQGCRFYPLIYDFETDDFTIDDLCIHHKEFDKEIYRPLFDSVQVFVYTLISERETRTKRTMEEEIKVEVRETKHILEDPLTEEMKKIETDKDKIESIIEQTILDVQDKDVLNLEESLKQEMKEIENEISGLEKEIREDIITAEEYIKITEDSINKDLEEIEKIEKNSKEKRKR